MPAFTHFTFGSSRNCFKRRLTEEESEKEGEQEEKQETGETGEEEEPFVTFSATFTLANVLLSSVGNVVYGPSMTHIAGWDKTWGVMPGTSGYLVLVMGFPTTSLGICTPYSVRSFCENTVPPCPHSWPSPDLPEYEETEHWNVSE